MFTAYEVDFLVFSGTTLSTSRFISSVTKTNRSPILTLNLIANLKPWSLGNWGISLGEYDSDIDQFYLGYIWSRDVFRSIVCERKYWWIINWKYLKWKIPTYKYHWKFWVQGWPYMYNNTIYFTLLEFITHYLLQLQQINNEWDVC